VTYWNTICKINYLNEETIQEVESLTPIQDEATLQELMEFLGLEKYVKEMRPQLSSDRTDST
jgi:hypothetical protein